MEPMDFYNNSSEVLERWVDICGYEGLYQISNLGRVRSCDRFVRNKHSHRLLKGQIIRPFEWGAGYQYVNLSHGRHKISISLHRLVALHFVDNPAHKPEVNHKDGNKHNNCEDNLEWVTSSENERHAFENGMVHMTHLRPVVCTHSETGHVNECASCVEADKLMGYQPGTTSAALRRRGGADGAVSLGVYIVQQKGA